MSKTDSHHIKRTRTGVRKRLASKHINSVLDKMVILPSKCEMLSLNVDWFDKNPINLTSNKDGLGIDLGKPIFIKPFDGSVAMDHKILAENPHALVNDNPPDDLEPTFLGVFLDVRLDTDA